MAEQEHPRDLRIHIFHTAEQVVGISLSAPALIIDTHRQCVYQIFSQRIHTRRLINGSHQLTHHVRVIFLEEIILSAATLVAERSSTSGNEDTLAIVNDFAHHFLHADTVNSLAQPGINLRSLCVAQTICTILLIEYQFIGISGCSNIKGNQFLIGIQLKLRNRLLRYIIGPGLVFNHPGGVTCALDVQNATILALLGIQTNDKHTGTGALGANHTGINRDGKLITINIFSHIITLDKVGRTIVTNSSIVITDTKFIGAGFGGRKQRIHPVIGIQLNVATAKTHMRSFIRNVLTGSCRISADGGEITGSIGHNYLSLSHLGSQLGFQEVTVKISIRAGDLNQIFTSGQNLFKGALGIDGTHCNLLAGLHKLHNELLGVSITQAVYHSYLIICFGRHRGVGSSGLFLATAAEHQAKNQQQAQRQGGITFHLSHTILLIY